MELLSLKIPFGYIERHVGQPTWHDILFGPSNGLADPSAARALAIRDLERDDAPPVLLDLADASEGESIRAAVETMAALEPERASADAKRKWLYLTLSWLFDHRRELRDPLGMVEVVYAEFDYPPAVAPFVRYMPIKQPDLGSRELGEARLLENWCRFLRSEGGRVDDPLPQPRRRLHDQHRPLSSSENQL